MDFSLTDEQRMIQQTVREFVEKELMVLEPEFLRNEMEGRPGITKEELHKLQLKAKEIGFWGINTPEEYGGANLDPVTTTLIKIELGKTIIPFQFGGSADNILYHCNEEQKKKYLIPLINGERLGCFALTEPGAGSDAASIRTTAVRDGDSWIINGEKIFITNGHSADFAMVFAVTDKEKGANGGITCFLVDRDMGWYSEPIEVMDGTEVASLVFDNVRVPHENILGEEGKGLQLGLQWITSGRINIPAQAIGIAERVLKMAISYANSRVAFGKPIGEYQGIQWMIADSAVEIEAAKMLVLRAAHLVQQGHDARHQASIAKLYGTNMVHRVVDRALQIHGGMGLSKELAIERFYRFVRKLRIFEGTDEIQRRTIARNLLKGYAKVGD